MSQSVFGLLLNYLDASRSIRCICSLFEEGVGHVVVWDNSADDGSSAAQISDFFGEEPRLEILVSATNLGFAAGVNAGLRHCVSVDQQGWVLIINNDARLMTGALQHLVEALQAQPNAKLAFPNVNHAGRTLGLAYCHRVTGLLSWIPRLGCFPYASGCCMLVVPARTGLPLFDEDFFMYGEDCELGWRLSRSPGAIVHVDRTLVEHEGTASSGLGSLFYETSMVSAHLILARKLARSPGERWLLHVSRGVMLLLRAVVRSCRFRSLTPWIALARGARAARSSR